MSGLGPYLRSLDPRLPRTVWTVEAGGLVNAFGNGVTFPFVVIYLHNVRGFSLGTAGLVLAVGAAIGLVAGPVAGPLVDRIGGRATLALALVLMAVGYGAFPLVREPWHAYAFSLVAGVGNGFFWPSQSTLLAALAPPLRRHAAYALQRVSRNLGIGLGGVAGGLIASTSEPATFTVLFVLDAATFVAFAAVLPLVPEPRLEREQVELPRRYLEVLRHRVFMLVVGLNVLFVAAGYAMLELLPAFAKNEAAVSERAIGVIFFVNTAVIVLAQLPVSKLLEGRRRMRALAAMTALWAAAWIVVLAGGLWFEAVAAATVFAFAALVFGVGECFQGPVQGRSSSISPRSACAAAIWPSRPRPGSSDSWSAQRLAASCSTRSRSRSGRSRPAFVLSRVSARSRSSAGSRASCGSPLPSGLGYR